MKIYVAGASAEAERAARFIDAARGLGHEITFDWVPVVRSQTVPEWELPSALRRSSAREDLAGVRGADLLVVLVPHKEVLSRGVWVELGYALGRRDVTDVAPKVWCVGPWAVASIFTELADEIHFSDAAALAALGTG